MADAPDSKSGEFISCGFKSHHQYLEKAMNPIKIYEPQMKFGSVITFNNKTFQKVPHNKPFLINPQEHDLTMRWAIQLESIVRWSFLN